MNSVGQNFKIIRLVSAHQTKIQSFSSLTPYIAKSRAISTRNLAFGGYNIEKYGVLRAMERETCVTCVKRCV